MTNQSPPKNHCMVVLAYYPIGETRVQREALALVAAGYEVDVICMRHHDEPAYEVVDGVQVHRLPFRRRVKRAYLSQVFEYLRFFFLAFFKVARLYRRKRFATVQAHNLPDFLIFSALIPKLGGAKLILDIHDIMPEFLAARTGKDMKSLPVRLMILQEQLSCRFADFVITVTDLWKERLIQRGVRGDKVGVVMNLADEKIFKPLPIEERPPRKEDRFTLIYHGSFKRRYGMDVLLRAVALARQQVPDLLVILQGVGEYAETMFAMVDELGLAENVRINNFGISAEELPELIYQADMGVVPNYEDVFTGELLPTKLLEYAALGVPAIAARTRVISAYFDERMVRFFTPGDERSLAEAIVEAYRQRERLPEQARELERFTSRYNWECMARHYVQMIDRLGCKSGRGASAKPDRIKEGILR